MCHMEIKINNSYKREKKSIHNNNDKKKKEVRTLHQTEITEVT